MAEERNVARTALNDLPAKLASDRAAAARNEHALAAQQLADPRNVGVDGFTPQEVFDVHVAKLAYADLSVQDGGDPGKDLCRDAGVLAVGQDLAYLLAGGARHGDDHLRDFHVPDYVTKMVAGS